MSLTERYDRLEDGRLIRHQWIAPVALLLAACAAPSGRYPLPTAYEVHVAPTWYADTPQVLQALADWTAATGVVLRPIVTADPCPDAAGCIAVQPEAVSLIEAQVGSPQAIGGTALGLDPTASIDPDLNATNPALFMHVLRHELGHALGLSHVTDQGALMFPDTRGSDTITPNDIAQYWSLR